MSDEPSHFNVIICGTGVIESVVSAALAKAGYSVLHLDKSAVYGDNSASLTLKELISWTKETHPFISSVTTTPISEVDLSQSNKYSLSLDPLLLSATGSGIELLIKSRVATYLQFGLLNGISLWGDGKLNRVPSSKADIFNDTQMSLVEKRRVTKLLLFAASDDDHALLKEKTSIIDFLTRGFALSEKLAESIAFALALATDKTEDAAHCIARLRVMIHSTGRYGPSPFLVGHYGGVGDLVGGFARVCAVWGGGQILGRPILPLVRKHSIGAAVQAKPLLSLLSKTAEETPPAILAVDQEHALGVPVQIDPSGDASTFTADKVLSSATHLPTLFPDLSFSGKPQSIHSISILSAPIEMPTPFTTTSDEQDFPTHDSFLIVFPPGSTASSNTRTVVGLVVGSGTFSCPPGQSVLYLSASVKETKDDAQSILQPFIDLLLQQNDNVNALYSVFYVSSILNPSEGLPENLVVTPSLPEYKPSSITGTLDAVAEYAERVFWDIVGPDAKSEGVEFFKPSPQDNPDD